jgi:tetratricopeptide (TPR) repeat protein/DNA-binding MarR family transcriptional regulator
MTEPSFQMIFSPQNCPLERLDKTLTPDRRLIAEAILDEVRSGLTHNNLIVGPRGTGKTHLLRYVYKTLREQVDTGRDMALIALPEEERGIATLTDFLQICVRAAGLSPGEILKRIADPDPIRKRDQAAAIFEETVGDRSTLIVVENLHDVFDRLDEQDLPALRAFLQAHPRISLLASSIGLFPNSSRPDHPFYGYFTIHYLNPLTRKDARIYLSLLAQADGDHELAAKLRSPESQPRVNAIYALTGGNHRLFAMLSMFLTVEGLDELVGPFVQMADRELTPYYQQRLDRLSPQQYKIVRAIVDQEGAALHVNEIAQYAGLTPQATSSLLRDLLSAGLVKRTQHKRESHYELREPLLRLVLDLKQGTENPLPLIVNLIKQWYTPKELHKLESLTSGLALRYCQAALAEKEKDIAGTVGTKKIGAAGGVSLPLLQVQGAATVKDSVTALLREIQDLLERGQYEDALRRADEVLQLDAHNPYGLSSRCQALYSLGRYEEVLATCDAILESVGSHQHAQEREQAAGALFNKGLALDALSRTDQALECYDSVMARFGSCEEPEFQRIVASAFLGRSIALDALARSKEALESYDAVVTRFGSCERSELQETVASAVFDKGVTLAALGRSEQALECYDSVVARFGSYKEPEFQRIVASALVRKGCALEALGRIAEALECHDTVLARFGLYEAPEFQETIATALFNRGVMLRFLGRADEALVTYNNVVMRFGSCNGLELRQIVGNALVNKGVTLGVLGHPDEAIAACDAAVEWCASSNRPQLLDLAACALINKARAFVTLGRADEALTLLDSVVARFGSSDVPDLRLLVVAALINKSDLLRTLRRYESALEACERALQLDATHANAVALRTLLLSELRHEADGLKSLEEFLTLVPTGDQLRSRLLGNLISEPLGRESTLREIVRCFGDDKQSIGDALIQWVRQHLPKTKREAEDLEERERVLQEVFGNITEAKSALDMIEAARLRALGDEKAMFKLPLELRRLVEEAIKGAQEGNGE